MMPLRVLVLTTSVCLIGTKFLDCYSMMSQLDNPEDELNPLGRAAINRVGKRAAIWGGSLSPISETPVPGTPPIPPPPSLNH
jgi:hypothetical protein